MKLLVSGFYNKGNIGDEAYKQSFPMLFSGHELTFADRVTKDLVKSHDGIILGGGNILNKHYLSALRPYAGSKPMIAFSVGHTDEIDYSDMGMFSGVYVRDYHALKRLRDNGVPCTYCPDAAFSLVPNVERGRMILRRLISEGVIDPQKKTIGVVINGHLSGHGQDNLARDMFRFQTFSMDMANVLDRLDANCVFMSMMARPPWDDRVAGGWVSSKCRRWNKNVVVYDKLCVQDTLDVISAMDAMVSMRLHSSIFAAISGVPFVDIWHHDKNLSFLETVGRLGWAVPFWDFSREKTMNLLGDLMNSEGEGDGLKDVAAKKKDLLMGTVNGIHFD